jgi:uncharacterized protein YbaA (DUF1428 family)
MSFVDGVVVAVPEANRAAYVAAAERLAALFLECGALEVVDAWGADVPEGKLTSFPMAVKREPGEAVVFSWIRWPSREVREAGWARAMQDPRMQGVTNEIFDGARMIYGGFEVIQSRGRGA